MLCHGFVVTEIVVDHVNVHLVEVCCSSLADDRRKLLYVSVTARQLIFPLID